MGPLEGAWRASTTDEAPSEETLAAAVAAARTALAPIVVEDETLVAALAGIGQLPEHDRIVELALALGCARGDGAALQRFEAELVREVPHHVAHLRLDGAALSDVVQEVRSRLLVADGGPPKIVDYAGRGRMHGLVKVIAVRAALDLLERKKKDAPGDAGLDRAIAPERDPELQYLDAHYRAAFAEAFEEAAKSLERRERNWLRMHLLSGAGLEEIATMYGVSRSTVVRTLEKARTHLLEETRKGMRRKLQIGLVELDSIMRLVGSRLDASVARVLRSSAG